MPRRRKNGLEFWSIPVPGVLNRAVEEAVRVDMHVSKSDFIRDAVRQKLVRMGLGSVTLKASLKEEE